MISVIQVFIISGFNVVAFWCIVHVTRVQSLISVFQYATVTIFTCVILVWGTQTSPFILNSDRIINTAQRQTA